MPTHKLSIKAQAITSSAEKEFKKTKVFCRKKIGSGISPAQVHQEIQHGMNFTKELHKIENNLSDLMHEANANIIGGGKLAAKTLYKGLHEIKASITCMKAAIFTKCHILNLQFYEKPSPGRQEQTAKLKHAMQQNLAEAQIHFIKGAKLIARGLLLALKANHRVSKLPDKASQLFSKFSSHISNILTPDKPTKSKKPKMPRAD